MSSISKGGVVESSPGAKRPDHCPPHAEVFYPLIKISGMTGRRGALVSGCRRRTTARGKFDVSRRSVVALRGSAGGPIPHLGLPHAAPGAVIKWSSGR